MSSHCGKYPTCGCPKEIGYCPDGLTKLINDHKLIIKTDGNCNEIVVDHPDIFNDLGQVVKRRNRGTNFTPKKKKRR